MTMLSVRLLGNSMLLVKFVGCQNNMQIFNCMAFNAPNTHTVQGSTVYLGVELLGYMVTLCFII